MTQKMNPVSLSDFSYGLNDTDDASLIADNALAAVENFEIGRGYMRLRSGFVKYTPAALPASVEQIYTFYKNDGTNEFLAVSGAKLYKDAAGTLSQVPFSTITALTSSNTQMLTYKDRQPPPTAPKDCVLIADGGKLKTYNGTNVSEVAAYGPSTAELSDPGSNDLVNLTNFRAIAIKQDRIFALAHASVRNRLSFCHHDPKLGYATFDYWPATHFYDLVSQENDESLALRTFRNAIIVFNRRSMWSLTGDGRTVDDYELRKINVPSGLLAPNSVCYVGNYLFYLSDDHVYALYSTDRDYISAEVASRDIENSIKAIPLEDRKKAVGAYNDGKYILSFPDGTTLVLDTTLATQYSKYGAWTKWTNIRANCFLERDGYLYFSADSGHIFKLDPEALNDDGSVITGMFRTKRLDFGYPVQVKKFKRFWIVAKQYDVQASTFNFSVLIDEILRNIEDISTDESGIYDEAEWDDATWDFKDVVQKRIRVSERGKTLQYEITHDTLNEPLTVYQIVTQFKLKKAK